MKKIYLVLFLMVSTLVASAQCSYDSLIYETGAGIWNPVYSSFNNTVFMRGVFADTARITGGPTYVDNANPGVGQYIAQYDTLGNFINAFQLTSISGTFYYYYPSLATAGSNLYYAASYGYNGLTYIDLFSTNFSGITNWVQTFQGSDTLAGGIFNGQTSTAQITDIQLKQDSLLLLSGAFSDSLIVGLDTLASPNNPSISNFFVTSYDTAGNYKWSMQSDGSTGESKIYRLRVDANGNILIGGVFTGDTLKWGGQSFPLPSQSSAAPNFFIGKLDGNGVPQWFHFGNSNQYSAVYAMELDGLDNVYISGYKNTSKTYKYLAKYDPAGNQLWENDYGIGASFDGVGLAVRDTAVYVTTGNNVEAQWVVNDQVDASLPPLKGEYLVKFDPSGNFKWLSAINASPYGATPWLGKDILALANNSGSKGIGMELINVAQHPVPIAHIAAPSGLILGSAQLSAYQGSGYTYQWYRNDTLIAGINTPTYTPLSTGDYKVEVQNGNGCGDFSNVLSVISSPTAASDSLALVDLYNATSGANWSSASGWLSGPVSSWEGVTVTAGRVTQLFLDNHNLRGTLPSSFWNLTSLKEFRLWGNPYLALQLNAAISNMQQLQVLDFGGSFVTGSIPLEIGTLDSLREIQLYGSSLSGTLPSEIGNLSGLQILSIGGGSTPTTISGTIPSSYSNLTNLKELHLDNNQLTGAVSDTIWQLPNLERISVNGNVELDANLPSNLGSLTQLKALGISKSKPIGGPIPSAFFQLTNLEVLDAGGQGFTGNIPASIQNLTKLKQLWLWSNKLSGAVPTEITTLDSLQNIGLNWNFLDSLPDLSGMSNLQQLTVDHNYLDWTDIVPNIGVPNATFFPVFPLANKDIITKKVAIGGSGSVTTAVQGPGTNYQWYYNNNTIVPGATSATLTLTNFSIAKAGYYRCRTTNSVAPGAVISSEAFYLTPDEPTKSWYVDNRPGTLADFRSLSDAVAKTNAGDTIYVAGSKNPYDTNAGTTYLNTPRVIFGPGIILSANPKTQVNKDSAVVDFNLVLQKGSDGSIIQGLTFHKNLYLNSGYYKLGDTLTNVLIKGNHFLSEDPYTFAIYLISHQKNIEITNNFRGYVAFGGSDATSPTPYEAAYYADINIHHNLGMNISNTAGNPDIIPKYNGMVNISIEHNVLDTLSGFSGVSIKNNVIKLDQTSGNFEGFNLTTDYTSGGVFQNNSGNFSADNDFKLSATSPAIGAGESGTDIGAFGGATPFILSGLPPIPAVYDAAVGNTLEVSLSAKDNDSSASNIDKMFYTLVKGGKVVNRIYKASGFTPQNDISLAFRPSPKGLVPDSTYLLYLVAIDANGIKSHRTILPYKAISANISGAVTDKATVPVNNGFVRLFAINKYSGRYDTTAVYDLNNGNTYAFNKVILGDYIMLADPDTISYPNLLPTYLGNTIDWQLADTIALTGDTSNVVIQNETVPTVANPGTSLVYGAVTQNLSEDTVLRVRPVGAARGAGVSIRRRGVSVRDHNPGLRLLGGASTELVAYVKTDDKGNFTFPDLAAGDYQINVDFPGVPVDTSSYTIFTLTGEKGENLELSATITDDAITVEKVKYLGIGDRQLVEAMRVYPNPTTTTVTLMADFAQLKRPSVAIYNLQGGEMVRKDIAAGDKAQLDVKDYPSGVYLLKVYENGQAIGMAKFVKK